MRQFASVAVVRSFGRSVAATVAATIDRPVGRSVRRRSSSATLTHTHARASSQANVAAADVTFGCNSHDHLWPSSVFGGSSADCSCHSHLKTVEVAPGRFLLVLTDGATTEALEVALHDVLDDLSPSDSDHAPVGCLLKRLAELRKGRVVSGAQILLLSL